MLSVPETVAPASGALNHTSSEPEPGGGVVAVVVLVEVLVEVLVDVLVFVEVLVELVVPLLLTVTGMELVVSSLLLLQVRTHIVCVPSRTSFVSKVQLYGA